MGIKAYFKEVKTHFHFTSKRVLISEESSVDFDHTTFVIIEDDQTGEELYNLQINSEHNCDVFRDLILWQGNVVIGFDTYAYIFNIETERAIRHKLLSYFDSFYVNNEYLLICSTSNINCFNNKCIFLWRSHKLGSESVKVTKIEGEVIYGSGKWDESGWKEFQLPLLNGGVESKPKKKSILASLFKKKRGIDFNE